MDSLYIYIYALQLQKWLSKKNIINNYNKRYDVKDDNNNNYNIFVYLSSSLAAGRRVINPAHMHKTRKMNKKEVLKDKKKQYTKQ